MTAHYVALPHTGKSAPLPRSVASFFRGYQVNERSADYADCEGIISESELVFDSGIKRIVYSVTDYSGEDGFSTAYFYSLEEAKAEINRRFNELGYQEQAKKAKSNDYILISEELEDEDGEFIGDINSIEAFYWKDYVLEERIKKNTKYVLEEESNYGFWRNFGTR